MDVARLGEEPQRVLPAESVSRAGGVCTRRNLRGAPLPIVNCRRTRGLHGVRAPPSSPGPARESVQAEAGLRSQRLARPEEGRTTEVASPLRPRLPASELQWSAARSPGLSAGGHQECDPLPSPVNLAKTARAGQVLT